MVRTDAENQTIGPVFFLKLKGIIKMMPEKFYKPWEEIDESLKHGGISGELQGNFVGPDLGDNPKTSNRDMKLIFEEVRDVAASISMMPGADVEGPPSHSAVKEVLQGLNHFFERVLDRTMVCSTPSFQFTHAIPPSENFTLRPIHYPLRNQFVDGFIFYSLGTMVEIAEANYNGQHANLDPSTAHRVLGPLAHFKKNLIKDWFDKEVANEITLEELTELFRGIAKPGPEIVPAGEFLESPDPTKVEEALSGIDIFQWYPTNEDWQIFGKKHTEMYKPERIWQPEGAYTPTEDVAPEDPVKAEAPAAPVG